MPRIASGLNQRRVDVYLAAAADKDRWNDEAERRGMPLTQLVIQIVEAGLAPPSEMEASAPALAQEVDNLGQQNATLHRRVVELEALLTRAEADLAEYRAQQFLGPSAVKQLEPRLVRLFADARDHYGRLRIVDEKELKRVMAVKTEVQADALAKQVEFLEAHEIVKRSGKGWIWIG